MKDLLKNKLFRICLIFIIVVIVIMVLIALIVGGGSKRITETSLINAAKKYYSAYPNLLPTENFDSTTVSLSTLVSTGYINSESEGVSCPSYVTVTNMNGVYDYVPYLMCNNNSTLLVNKLKVNTVNDGAGLYNLNGNFIFRGDNPNNYIKLGNLKWRIMGIDENNNIKIIYNDIYTEYQPWDDRYNKELNDQFGVNDYVGSEKSRIKEYLDNFFNIDVIKDSFTSKIVGLTTKHSVCIGKLNIEKNNTNICSDVLENQRVSTLTVNDYVNTSLDSSCSITNSISCQNYNFLNKSGWTINANSENTYEVYRINPYDGLQLGRASYANAIRPVIALKNDVIYVSGSGTELDPYIIK